MKKIVAVVLALVMVLGLATTAFAATAKTPTDKNLGDFYMELTDKAKTGGVVSKLHAYGAVAPKDVNENGLIDTDELGAVAFYQAEGTVTKFVQVNSVQEADGAFYYLKGNNEKSDTLFMYFAFLEINPEYAGTAVAFANFGEDCGQYDFDPEDDTKYYMFQGDVYTVDVTETSTVSLMVDGKLTAVTKVATKAAKVAHIPAYTYDKAYKIVAVKCAECGLDATIYPNYASVPKADKKVGNAYLINTSEYYSWNAAKAPAADAETDKVESAQTFDAGIAMYVGMSVMAAAGSAVVLKKKD